MMIELVTGLLVSYASSASIEIFKSLLGDPSLSDKIDKAYNRALKKWIKNDSIRDSFARKKIQTLESLAGYVVGNVDCNTEIAKLLPIFETELKRESITYQAIQEIINKETLATSRHTLMCVSEGFEQSSQEHSKLLGEIKELKQLMVLKVKEMPSSNKQLATSSQYFKPQKYITRRVRDYQSYDIGYYMTPKQYEPQPLVNYILDGCNHLVLYSEAQLGKTTELNNLAFELQNSGLYYPYFFKLSLYNSRESLETQLSVSSLMSNGLPTVIIFDGLDEVEDSHRNSLVNDIELIAEKYADLCIVVSCRGNYEDANEISMFKKLYLNGLNWEDAKKYINENCSVSAKLVAAIEQEAFYEVIHSPFYLQSVIDYFTENKNLPENKTVIYEYVIDRSFKLDNKRQKTTHSIKAQLYPILERVAFCLQMTQRQELTIDELISELKLTDDDISLCDRSSIISHNLDNISFCHNSFKEYIVAKHLSKLQFKQVMEAVCFTNSQKVKPSMYNVSILLLGIIDSQSELEAQLISLFEQNDIDIIIRCGGEHFEGKKREELFLTIFNKYKKTRGWIDYDFVKPLSLFANTKKVLQFLLTEVEIEQALSPNMINALKLLKYAKFSLLNLEEDKQAKNLLLATLAKFQDDKDNGDYLFDPFENQYFYAEHAFIHQLWELIKDSTNPSVLNPFFQLITNANICDHYADWIIGKIEYIHDFTSLYGCRRTVSKDYLTGALKGFVDAGNILKAIEIVQQYDPKPHFYQREYDILIALFDNLRNATEDKIVTCNELIVILARTKTRYLTMKVAQLYKEYFDYSVDNNEIFDDIYPQTKEVFLQLYHNKVGVSLSKLREKLNILVLVLNQESFDSILSDSSMDEHQLYCLTSYFNSYLCFKSEWSIALMARFTPLISQNNHWERQNQEAFDILFDRKAFLRQIYELCGNKQRVKRDLESGRELVSNSINQAVIDFVWECGKERGKTVATSVIKSKAKDDTFFMCFVINRLSQFSKKDGIVISIKQTHEIHSYIIDVLENDSKFTNMEGVAQIIIDYDLAITDNLLMKLFYLSSHFFDYLVNNLSDKNILDSKVVEVLTADNNRDEGLIWILLNYIIDNRKENMYKYFTNIISMPHSDPASHKQSVINAILKLGRDGLMLVMDIKSTFDQEVMIDFYQLLILRQERLTVAYEEEEICNYLEQIYPNCTKESQSKILRILLALGSSNGLKWCFSYSQENSEWRLDAMHFPSLHKYKGNEIDRLIAIFQFALTLDIPKGHFHSILDASISSLQNCAMESETLRDKVVLLLRDSGASNEKHSYLYRIADNTYDKFFEANAGVISFAQAYCMFNALLKFRI